MSKKLVICWIILVLECAAVTNGKRSLGTKFADITLAGLKPGMVYSIKKERNLPYKVTNWAEEEADVEVVVEKPLSDRLKEGYEALPDVSWIKIFPSRFHLKPGENTNCDIIIAIPEDEKYANRHYQAKLVTKTVENPNVRGIAVGFAIATRLRFSTGPSPEIAMNEYRKKVLDALKIELTPLSLFLPEISVGQKEKLDGEAMSTLQIINKGKTAYKVEFKIVNPKNYGLTRDYEPIPDDVKVKFKKKKLVVKKRSITDVIMEVEVPAKEEYYGKNYAFVVVARVLSLDIPIELFSRVYFSTEKNEEKQ